MTDAAIAALPPGLRRKMVITVDGAGASVLRIVRAQRICGSIWALY
ncbi:MAG: hypothetical protein ACRDPY_02520 [Streptosporangiaceae bacterium]